MELKVVEVKPQNAVTIIECDMNVEFDAPEGYVEPEYNKKTEMPEAPLEKLVKRDHPFSSQGYRLDGKTRPTRTPLVSESQDDKMPEILELGPLKPDYDYKPGSLVFPRYNYKNRGVLERELAEKQSGTTGGFKPFEGTGYTIRSTKR